MLQTSAASSHLPAAGVKRQATDDCHALLRTAEASAAVRHCLAPSASVARPTILPYLSPHQHQLQGLSMQLGTRHSRVRASTHPLFAAAHLPEWDQLPDQERAMANPDAWLAHLGPDGAPANSSAYQAYVAAADGAARRATGAHPSDALIERALNLASRDGRRGATHTGVRAWKAFAQDEGVSMARPMEAYAPLGARLHEELLAMRFVCALVQVRGVKPSTAAGYWSAVQGWHAREFGVKIGAGIKMERLPQMLKGLRREFGDAPSKIRRGIAPQALRRAMDLCLSKEDAAHANIRAALALALQGLLRSAEFSVDPGVQWNPKTMVSRGDIVELTDERMTIMFQPCKNMKHLGGKTCPLVIGAGGEYIDAVWELKNMLRLDPVAPGVDPRSVPLFRVPGTREPLRTNQIMSTTRNLMRSIGENPAQFGTHSYRIGGATALFAQGADPTVIRTMGRWSSDIYNLYVRASFERCVEWTRRAGSATVTDVAQVYEFDEVEHY
jgi:hypothetical protein